MKTPVLSLMVAILIAVISGCSKNPADSSRVHSFSGPTMGTSYTVKVVADEDVDLTSLQAEVGAILKRINDHMSTYQNDSELSLFNQSPAGDWFPVSAETAQVVSLGLEISELTDGAFDSTVGPLVNLWGFGPDPLKVQAPADAEIAERMAQVGYQHISARLDPAALKKSADAYVDLSAIAKGYAVDAVAEAVAEHYPNYLVEVGGELRAQGHKPDGDLWRIAVESPVAGTRQIQRVIAVDNTAIATSGDYRNYFEQNGVRYSHTIDPATGKPISHGLASVTVLDPSSARADAMATAMMVMGEEKSMALAKKLNMPVFLIYKTEDGFVEEYTDAFKPYLQ